jgi:hypothetical protein
MNQNGKPSRWSTDPEERKAYYSIYFQKNKDRITCNTKKRHIKKQAMKPKLEQFMFSSPGRPKKNP